MQGVRLCSPRRHNSDRLGNDDILLSALSAFGDGFLFGSGHYLGSLDLHPDVLDPYFGVELRP